MAEGGIGEHGDPGLITHAPREACRFFGDVRDLLGVRHVVDGGVGDQNRTAPAERDRDADDAVARLCVDDAANVFKHGRSRCALRR